MKCSWTIFAGASDIYKTEEFPIACSAKNYIFEEIDKKNLEEFRHWIKIHFRQKDSLTYSKETKLMNRNSDTNDYDFLVMVLKKKETDNLIMYLVQDESDSCELHAEKYFNFLETNDIIRVRNIKSIEGKR